MDQAVKLGKGVKDLFPYLHVHLNRASFKYSCFLAKSGSNWADNILSIGKNTLIHIASAVFCPLVLITTCIVPFFMLTKREQCCNFFLSCDIHKVVLA